MLPLKDATSSKHKEAERMPFNTRMLNGQLNKKEYLLYLNQQLEIFKAIENIGLPYDKLARTPNIESDIAQLNTQGYYSDEILDSTRSYVEYLKGLAYQQILPHIYLNYMAIMFGGQLMKKAVPSEGKMYDFDDMRTAVQSIRNVQRDEWADEVNKGFDYIIGIFNALEQACASQPKPGITLAK